MPKSLLRSLTGRRDFDLVFKEGASLASQHLVIYARLNQLGFHRLGLAVGRKLGNAVVRNRIKRLLRESMRKVLEEIPLRTDFVIIARKSSVKGELEDFIRDIRRFLQAMPKLKAGVSER
jgi:ribonuclease P protein component